jgi:hypothetical protein
VGRPIGNKKAKAVVVTTTSSNRVQSPIDKCLLEVTSSKSLKYEESDTKWAVLMEKQDIKMELEKETVAVKRKKKPS